MDRHIIAYILRSRVSDPACIAELRQDAQTWNKIVIHVRHLIHSILAARQPPTIIRVRGAVPERRFGHQGHQPASAGGEKSHSERQQAQIRAGIWLFERWKPWNHRFDRSNQGSATGDHAFCRSINSDVKR